LNASCKYIKFEANTFKAISVKKIIRKTLSIYDKIKSLTTEDPSEVNSAFVNQKRVKNVYTVIIDNESVSKGVDSKTFRTRDLS
jgi:hypothetical protein